VGSKLKTPPQNREGYTILKALPVSKVPWSKGRLIGQKQPPEIPKGLVDRVRLEIASCHRDLALFNLAIDSKLRSCDLVKLKIIDVVSHNVMVGVNHDDYGTHSLRQNKATLIYKRTKKFAPFNFYWDTQNSRARSVSLESMLITD